MSSSFPSVRIEGGLLGPDLLDQLLAGDLPGQRPADFGLDARRNLTDEIAATFADARALWTVFQHRRERLPETDPGTTVTRDAWMVPFLGLLGYEPRYNPRAYEVDGLTFAISHRAAEAEDTPPIHVVGAGQELGRVPASGRPRLAPHSLVQEYLNRTEHVWGLVTNGLTLRLLRDCTLVRRQAYVEFDLTGIFEEQRFHDFAALYRLLHRTRLPRGMADASDCLLERYYAHSVEQGGRVRDRLRDGVQEAISTFANGFLAHPANDEFRAELRSGRVDGPAFFRELLRLIYRLLFLMVSEERGLLSKDPTYTRHYSVTRLRSLLDVRAAYTEHDDLWLGLRTVFRVLQDERFGDVLGLPALNGELFAPLRLDCLALRNVEFLTAFWHLSNYEADGCVRRVNYAALDVEELGSVYDSLLELHAHIDGDRSPPSFDLVVEGSERRSTGSHYTPPELVAPLIEHALEPVLKARLIAAGQDGRAAEQAILSLKVCDLACGSGHLLLAAARRLGKELARVRTGEDEPAPERVREAIRDVVVHCIYGVDKNPLAVELCRVALWLESHSEGKPLTFLDHRIRCGDSLVGVFDPKVLEGGIPDEAFKPVTGDDKSVARAAKKRNAEERDTGQRAFSFAPAAAVAELSAEVHHLDDMPEDSIEQVRAKADAFHRLEAEGSEHARLEVACNLWTAAFFQTFGAGSQHLVTNDALRSALQGRGALDARLLGWAMRTALEHRFFHWPLAFPEVLASGGFDVFLGNPPFMGGLKISEQFGDKYRDWLDASIEGFKGIADICAAFFRRAFDSVNEQGTFGLIATNSIAQGDTRIAGLAQIVRRGGSIRFASRFVKWPGRANVEVNLVCCSKSGLDASPVLDGEAVDFVSSRLDEEPEAEPATLRGGLNKAFQGDVARGTGFVLEASEAEELLADDPALSDCVAPYLNGDDLNETPDQTPQRWVICFHDWPLEKAAQYRQPFDIVRVLVKPERERVKQKGERERWWLFGRYRGEMRVAIRNLARVLVRSRISDTHALAFVPNGWIYNEKTIVFAFDDYLSFAVLQSNAHESWVRKFTGTLRTDTSYAPTYCFETFPFPQSSPATARAEAERIGEEYHEHRRQLMLARPLGLTKTYNLFHNPECTDADIARLRELHTAMDRAILACYGWADLDPGHGFHKNERGQTRYTISPTARRELLRRLLELNLKIAAEEELRCAEQAEQRRRARHVRAPSAEPQPTFPAGLAESHASITRLWRIVKPSQAGKYKTCVPILNLKAAAGGFSDWQNPRWDGWAEVKAHTPLRRGMFIAQVEGHSMEPLISDGAWCLFLRQAPSIRDGMVAIVQHRDIHDPETGGNYTIKRLGRVRGVTADGTPGYIAVRLEPENPAFEPMSVSETSETQLQVIGEFVEVLAL